MRILMTMQRLTLLPMLLGLALLAGPSAAQDAWKTVTARDGSFTVEMPAEPEYTTTPVKTGGGRDYTRYNYIAEEGGRAFVVQTATYPSDVNLSKPKANLQAGLDSAASQMEGGKWANVRWTSYQGQPATDARAMRPPFEVRNFSVIKGRTIFTLTYAGPPGTAQSADVNRFINSFLAKK
jgi:hypothetical protein